VDTGLRTPDHCPVAWLVESGPRLTVRPPTDPLAARVKTVQARLAQAYQARRGKVEDGRTRGEP
jgi:hypothetical protein